MKSPVYATAPGREGELTLHKLNMKLKPQRDNAKMNTITLQSACELLKELEYIDLDKKTDRTYVSLTDKGKELANKL